MPIRCETQRLVYRTGGQSVSTRGTCVREITGQSGHGADAILLAEFIDHHIVVSHRLDVDK